MNSPVFLNKKLKELIMLAKSAENGFEKASVYAASQAIANDFDKNSQHFDSYTMEKIHNTCWHIRAAIGYDITNGHSSSSHITWALGEQSTLENLLDERTQLIQD